MLILWGLLGVLLGIATPIVFRKFFVPPELTAFERELVRQVQNLEGQLHRERERYDELTQRLLFPSNGPVPEQTGVNLSVPSPIIPARQRAKELSDLSKARWLAHADAVVAEAEERMRNRGKEEGSTEQGQ